MGNYGYNYLDHLHSVTAYDNGQQLMVDDGFNSLVSPLHNGDPSHERVVEDPFQNTKKAVCMAFS